MGNCVKVPQHRHATAFTDLKEKNHVVNLDCRVCSLVHIQDGAKVSLQWFVWKTMQLINTNTRINFCVLSTVNLLLPHLVHGWLDKGRKGAGLHGEPLLGMTWLRRLVLKG